MRWTRVSAFRISAISACMLLSGVAALSAPFAADAIQAALDRPAPPGPKVRYAMAFRDLGIGELDACSTAKYPMIERSEHGRATAFLVKASVPCGLEVRNPSHYAQDGTLHLSYETHFTGRADACDCEYRSVFALADLPTGLTRVEFSARFVPGK